MQSSVDNDPQFRKRYLTQKPNDLSLYRNQLYDIVADLTLSEIVNFCKSDKQINKTCQDDLRIMNLIREKQQQQVRQRTDEFLANENNRVGIFGPIKEAIFQKKLDIIDELIKRGYDPHSKYVYIKPIVDASREGYLGVVNRLLQDPRVDPSYDGNLSIIEALNYGHLDVVKRLLLDKRINPNEVTSWIKQNILVKAVEKGYVDIVELILQNPKTAPSINNNAALVAAINNKDLEIINILLADPRLVITDNESLTTAISRTNKDIRDRLAQDPKIRVIYSRELSR